MYKILTNFPHVNDAVLNILKCVTFLLLAAVLMMVLLHVFYFWNCPLTADKQTGTSSSTISLFVPHLTTQFAACLLAD